MISKDCEFFFKNVNNRFIIRCFGLKIQMTILKNENILLNKIDQERCSLKNGYTSLNRILFFLVQWGQLWLRFFIFDMQLARGQ